MDNLHVLLVDDAPADYFALETCLNAIAIEATIVKASSAEQALRFLLEANYALIVLDSSLPGFDAYETAALIRQRDRSRATPIIFLVDSNLDQQAMIRGYALGSVEYVTRPLVPEILNAKVSVFVALFQKTRAYYNQLEQSRRLQQKTLEDEALATMNREHTEVIETLNRIGQTLWAELDLQRLVQTVTDETTQLIGAEFGSFFYNLIDERGESYTLYTLSGVPRETFEGFPMPRNTHLFGPTFRGEGVVRCDDVTQDPRYGQNPPYYGKPEGHLPVVSYLAVPVVSRSGEVLGGLFFGHSEPAVFTERHERLLVGLASQTAIAMDNARLYTEAQKEIAQRQQTEQSLLSAVEFHRLLEGQLTILIEASYQLLGSLKLDEILSAILHLSRQLISADAYAIWRYVAANHEWRIIGAAGLSEAFQHNTLSSITNPPFNEPLLAQDVNSVPMLERRRDAYKQENIASMMVIPLPIFGQVSGSLAFYWHTQQEFKELQVRVATALANLVAAAVGSAELYEAQQRLRTEAQQAVRQRDEFLSIAAHELKTPVTSMRGFTQLNLRQLDKNGSLNPDQLRHSLEVVNKQSIKLSRLVNQLLDISRISSGHLTLDKQPINIVDLVNGVVTGIQLNATKHPIDVTMPDQLMAVVDSLRLEQVITNLLDNAIKFSPENTTIHVHVASQPNNHPSPTLCIEVVDHGTGIAPEHRQRIFERFYRTGEMPHVGGMGLGLYISQQIVALHGGTLEAHFPAEGGTHFVITLPVQ